MIQLTYNSELNYHFSQILSPSIMFNGIGNLEEWGQPLTSKHQGNIPSRNSSKSSSSSSSALCSLVEIEAFFPAKKFLTGVSYS